MRKQTLTAVIAVAVGMGMAVTAFAQGSTDPNAGAPQSAITGTTPGTQSTSQSNPSPEVVHQAQQKLKSQGLYDGPIDGLQGPQMRTAIRKYQQQIGLPETAMLDQQTLQHLLGT